MVRDVDSVREVRQSFSTDPAQKRAAFRVHNNAMPLEVTNVELATPDGNIRRLAHMFAAIEPEQQIASFGDHKDRRRDRVHSYYTSVTGQGQAGNYVDVPANEIRTPDW